MLDAGRPEPQPKQATSGQEPKLTAQIGKPGRTLQKVETYRPPRGASEPATRGGGFGNREAGCRKPDAAYDAAEDRDVAKTERRWWQDGRIERREN
ncbi:hypothetical protein E4U42_006370 [Claviceps africana]|uniref:Uncharacterized protein n=1 Tax=Claviceps africana TaxID=83212 RepID=A0A8K0JBX3_9HYPO|nr:hypothetical protein E4U42_006370 [Claviceps africana]